MGLALLGGPPRLVLEEGLAEIAVEAHRVVLALASPVHLRARVFRKG